MNAIVLPLDLSGLDPRFERIDAALSALLAGQARQEEALSALSDAIAALTQTATANKAETDTVVAFLHDHAAALNEAVTQGDLDAIAAVNAELQAETAALTGAVPASPPPTA